MNLSRLVSRLCGVIVFCLALNSCAGLRILSEFGSRSTCEGGIRGTPHNGVDIAASYGSEVLAAADGVVTLAGDYPFRPQSGAWCGTAVIIRHDDAGFLTEYCHLSQATVAVDTPVKRGDVIGYVGTTGYANPSGALPQCIHVHFGVLAGGFVDPLPRLDGCFDPKRTYPNDRLTYPIKC